MKNLCFLTTLLALTSCYKTHIDPNDLAGNSAPYEVNFVIEHNQIATNSYYYGRNGIFIGTTPPSGANSYLIPYDSCILQQTISFNGSMTGTITFDIELGGISIPDGHIPSITPSGTNTQNYLYPVYKDEALYVHIDNSSAAGGPQTVNVKLKLGPCD